MTLAKITTDPQRVVETKVATTTTGRTGEFRFSDLSEGQYSLKADLQGFVSFRKPSLTIKPGQTLPEDVALHVGNVSGRIVVTEPGQRRSLTTGQTSQPIRVGGNITSATLIRQVKPIYPDSAREAGIEGTVHLQGTIETDGSITGLSIISTSDWDLAKAALESVKQWRYEPTLLNNIPVEAVTEIIVEFKLAP